MLMSPWDITSDRYSDFSIIGARMKLSATGASGKSIFLKIYPSTPKKIIMPDVEDAVVDAVGAHHQKARIDVIRIGVRDPEYLNPQRDQREVQDHEHDVADVAAGDDPPDHVGVLLRRAAARGRGR